MNRAIEARIAKLEAKAPEPQSPSQFDGMTCDELTVFILEQYAELLACDDTPEEIRADAKREGARISWEITETVNFASGRWATIPSLNNYREHLESWQKRWAKVRPDQSDFVPSLNHNMEGDGFGRADPVTPDLMARRAKLWAHPIVKQIVKEAPTRQLPAKTILHECKSFQNGRPGKSSDNCTPQCKRECLNVRRGGFRISLKWLHCSDDALKRWSIRRQVRRSTCLPRHDSRIAAGACLPARPSDGRLSGKRILRAGSDVRANRRLRCGLGFNL